MKLTKREREELATLPDKWPARRTGPLKAMCNKLVKKGLAEYQVKGSFANDGYVRTEAGRAALRELSK